MSNPVSTWVPRLVLAGATLLGGGLGAGLNCSQMDDVDPDSNPAQARTTLTEDPNLDPFASGVEYIPMGELDAKPVPPSLIKVPTEDEISKYGKGKGAEALYGKDPAYEIHSLGRQILGPALEGAITPPNVAWGARGTYWMTYAHRVQQSRSSMYGIPWQRGFFSRKTVTGKLFRKMLPEALRSQVASSKHQQLLRTRGAAMTSVANGLMVLPHLSRLGTNIVAIANIEKNGTNGLGGAERAVIYTDTAMVTSHMIDYALYARGLAQIAKGNERGAIGSLSLSHRVNIVSNSLSIVVGALRLHAEIEREEKTGHSNPTSYFFSFMDMAFGITGITFSLYLLRRFRRLREEYEEELAAEKEAAEAEAADEDSKVAEGKAVEGDGKDGDASLVTKSNNILLGFLKLPPLVQDGMRSVGALGASAALGINGSNLGAALFSDVAADGMMLSPSLGLAGSALALGASYMLTPPTYAISRGLFAGGSLFIAVQTLHDFWPVITQFMGIG